MKKNYFKKIVKYAKKVFDIERILRNLSDCRKNPTYKTNEVVLLVLMGFLLRTRSFNNLNNMIKDDDFRNILPKGAKAPRIDAIRDTLKVIVPDGLRDILKHGVRKTRENKVFDNGTIDGLVVTAIDGTQTFNSDKKNCENCLIAFKKRKVEERNFHSSVVLSTVGGVAKLVIDFEPYRAGIDEATKDEGELTTAKGLVKRVSKNHKNFVDVVVYDAIACNSKWINACVEAGLDTVVRVKKNNNESINSIRKKVNKSDEVAIWRDIEGYENVKVYEGYFQMKNVEKELRFIKFLMKKPDGKRVQIMIVTTCLDMSLRTLFKIIRARQDIENSIFHNLKTECGLEHCFVHGGNAIEAVLCLIFIASNILQLFYHRRLKRVLQTQVELVRQLVKGLYTLKRDDELIFKTG